MANGEVKDIEFGNFLPIIGHLIDAVLDPVGKVIEKGSVNYWDIKLINLIKEKTNNKNDIIYRNGDLGTFDYPNSNIYPEGVKEGLRDAQFIKNRLNKNGTVKIISHSKGASFAVGYANGLLQSKLISDKQIEWHIMLAPYDWNDWEFEINGNYNNIAIRHGYDVISSPNKTAKYSKVIYIEKYLLDESYLDNFSGTLAEIMKNPLIETTRKKRDDKLKKEIAKNDIELDSTVVDKTKSRLNKSLTNNGNSAENIEQLRDKELELELELDVKVKVKIGDYISKKELECAISEMKKSFIKNHTINGFHKEIEKTIELLSDKKVFDEMDQSIIKEQIFNTEKVIFNRETNDYEGIKKLFDKNIEGCLELENKTP